MEIESNNEMGNPTEKFHPCISGRELDDVESGKNSSIDDAGKRILTAIEGKGQQSRRLSYDVVESD